VKLTVTSKVYKN